MFGTPFSGLDMLTVANILFSSVVVILAFSLLAYTLTYNFRSPVARRFALLLSCVMVTYAADVALNRVLSPGSASRWLRLQWLGIALLPAAYYTFSNAVLRTTNYETRLRSRISLAIYVVSLLSAAGAFFGSQLVGSVHFEPPLSYLEAGPLFWLFTLFFTFVAGLSLLNILKARSRCLTESSRHRMTYLLLGFIAPGIGIFPYLIVLSRLAVEAGSVIPILLVSLVGNTAVGALLVVMSYTVAYFGVLTPDRVVRYRLLRFFMRGPVVAILAILAIQTIPTVERILGLPRNIILFSVITGVIVLSQLLLSVTKSLVDRLIYREDREEVAWLRELDRRLLTSTDLRQFLDNNLTSLCELLRSPSGFVAAIVGPDLILESVVGPAGTRNRVLAVSDWSDALSEATLERQKTFPVQPAKPVEPLPDLLAAHSDRSGAPVRNGSANHHSPSSLPAPPVSHSGFWVWPLLEPVFNGEEERVLGILGVLARSESPRFSSDELAVLAQMLDRVALALADRRLQQQVFVALRRIIPGIDRIQSLRGIVPYVTDDVHAGVADLLDPSPIHNPEFSAWVKDALSHYWGGPKLTRSPLIGLRVVVRAVDRADGNPAKALRLVLGLAIERLRPAGHQNLSAPEWMLYNILEMRFIQGRKVREIAERLAMSESDLYRKQRVAIDQVARVLTEMEQSDAEDVGQMASRAGLNPVASLFVREETRK